jgi:hypothetical protein
MHGRLAGSGRPRRNAWALLVLVLVAAAGGCFVGVSAASANVVHPFKSQIVEAGGAPFGTVQGLAVDGAGDLYVSDGFNLAVDKFDSTGAPVTSWGFNGQLKEANGVPFFDPFGLAVDSSENLWVTDKGEGGVFQGVVDKFSSAGGFEAQGSGPPGGFPESGQNIASAAWSDAAGLLFVADGGNLWGLEASGAYSGVDLNESFSSCCNLLVAADNSGGASNGDLYVAVTGRDLVVRIHGSGSEAGGEAPFSEHASYIEGPTLIGTPGGGFGAIEGVAVDSAGNLYVAQRHAVDEFASSGQFLGEITGTPTGPGGALVPFGEVTAVGVGAASGDVYVADAGQARVDVFGPAAALPEATTLPASGVTATAATLNGEVNPNGVEVSECVFEYGESTAYGTTAACETEGGGPVGSGSSPVAVHAHVSGLNPGGEYHYRLRAANEHGESKGADQVFFTGASLDSTSVSQVTATSAVLEAEINPHGVQTSLHFEYDTRPYSEGEAPHGVSTPVGDAGSGEGDVSRASQIQGLEAQTVYHYRAIVSNALGRLEGPDHTFTTQGPSSAVLPDGRAWELVSPPNKHGYPLEPITEEGGLIEAAAAGGGIGYVALGPITGEPQGVRSPFDTQLLAVRGLGGWSTQDITTPHEEISQIEPGHPSEYKFFAEDLSASVVEPAGATPLSPKTTERTPYRREASGVFVPLVTAENVIAGTKFGGVEDPGSGVWSEGVEFRVATPDLRHVVLASPQALTAGFPPGFQPTEQTYLYELSGRTLTLISVLPGPGGEATPAELKHGGRGALSSDGNRVEFRSAATGGWYMRDVALAQTVQLDEVQGGAGGGGQALFQTASSDGSRVFFTDEAQLTPDATSRPGAPDLYMCEVTVLAGHLSCTLSDLSVDPNAGEHADVRGEVSAIDASGEHVYFAANGVLTATPNARGEHAVPGECASAADAPCDLYVYDTLSRQISLVAVLSSRDHPDWGEGLLSPPTRLTARSSPNGRYFTFMSQRSLTGYDNRDARSGRRDEEVFLFDSSSGVVRCVSCNPTGARPEGVFDKSFFPGLLVDHPHTWGQEGREQWLAGSIPGWTLANAGAVAIYQSRYLSDSGRLFFNAADALVPQDTNNLEDVYEFEPPGVGDCTSASQSFSSAAGGCVRLISSGTSKEESAFLDASQSGDEVFFLTASRLTPTDVDSAFDVYDAHVCSASSPCPPPPAAAAAACEGDACQNPSIPPSDQTPASLTYHGPGNLTPAAGRPAPTAAQIRAQKLAKALKACRRKKSRHARGVCRRKAIKKYGAHKAKRAGGRRGAGR